MIGSKGKNEGQDGADGEVPEKANRGPLVRLVAAVGAAVCIAAYMAMSQERATLPENPDRQVDEDGLVAVAVAPAVDPALEEEMELRRERRGDVLAAADRLLEPRDDDEDVGPRAGVEGEQDVVSESSPEPGPTPTVAAKGANPVAGSEIKAYSVTGGSLMPGGLVMVPADGDVLLAEEERELTLRREAQSGDIDAVYAFYQYLKEDKNDKSHLAERIVMLRKSAHGGVVPAMVDFAKAYETGDGVEISLMDAYAWLTVASAFGHKGLEDQRADIAAELGDIKAETAQRRAQKLLTDMSREARARAKNA